MKYLTDITKLKSLNNKKKLFIFPFNSKSRVIANLLKIKDATYLDNYASSKKFRIKKFSSIKKSRKNIFIINDPVYLKFLKKEIKFHGLNNFICIKQNLNHKFFKKINLDNEKINGNTLKKLFIKYNTDKGPYYYDEGIKIFSHSYHNFYHKHFKLKKRENIKILELGVFNGASSAAFKKYFSNKTQIFCIDLDKNLFKFTSKKIKFFETSYLNLKFIKKFTTKYKNFFDIIIEDGSHIKSHIIKNLKNYSKCLKKSGVFVIEDYRLCELFDHYNDEKKELSISQILKHIKMKKIFHSKILNKKIQKYLFSTFNNISEYKGKFLKNGKNISNIAFLE